MRGGLGLARREVARRLGRRLSCRSCRSLIGREGGRDRERERGREREHVGVGVLVNSLLGNNDCFEPALPGQSPLSGKPGQQLVDRVHDARGQCYSSPLLLYSRYRSWTVLEP
jgi:hypothetical protein